MTHCKGTQNTFNADEARGNGMFLSHNCEGGHGDDEKGENCKGPTAVKREGKVFS